MSKSVREAALDMRDKLDELGFESFLKTSGGKGYHVVVPLKPKADWAQVKGFAHDFAKAMEQAEPGALHRDAVQEGPRGPHLHRLSAQRPGRDRGRALFDAGPAGATVSMPLAWEEIEAGPLPNAFPIELQDPRSSD